MHSHTVLVSLEDKDNIESIIQLYSSDEMVSLRSVKCFLAGLPGVGKTTFLRRISRDIINLSKAGEENRHASTSMKSPLPVSITDDKTRFSSAAIGSDCTWQVQRSNEDNAAMMFKLFESKPLVKSTVKNRLRRLSLLYGEQTEGSTDESGRTSESIEGASTSSCSTSVCDITGDSKLSSTEQTPTATDEITPKSRTDSIGEYIKYVSSVKGKSSAKPLKRMSMIYFIDTGGQPEFHEILPIILRGSALYLIFFSLAHNLHDKVSVRYQLPLSDERSSVTYDACHSSIEMINQLISSFYSIYRREKEHCSYTFSSAEIKNHSRTTLFATYADCFKGEEQKKRLREVNNELQKCLEGTDFYRNKFFTHKHSEEPLLFTPIDNMNGSYQEIADVEKFLTDIIEKFSEVSLPRSFALFHLILQHKHGQKSGTCSVEEAIALSIECNIERDHVVDVLKYFHRQFGTILFYDEIAELKDIVICDPNILFRCIAEVIMGSFAGTRSYAASSEFVRTTGEIPSDVMKDLGKILVGQSLLKPYHVVCLLEHFKLLQRIERGDDEVVYFMPCLLHVNHKVLLSSYKEVSDLHNVIPSLLVHFKRRIYSCWHVLSIGCDPYYDSWMEAG